MAEQATVAQPAVQPTVQPTIVQPTAAAKDPTALAVEQVLEEDLGEAYQKMNPDLKAKFKKEGERISGTISEMVRRAKVNAVLVLKLISGWLKIIPGVNRFFLEQEAKIKTDKILKL